MTIVLGENRTISIEGQQCGECGVWFGLESNHRAKLVRENGSFYCPNGHSRRFVGQTEAERLREQLRRTEVCLANAREDARIQRQNRRVAERKTSAQKGVVTRMKRRISKGRCVCCSREFKDLGRHMANQHPKWNPDKHAAAIEAQAAVSSTGTQE
jgi:uncharacterized Zn finger protein (UPF0148 family)